MSDETAVDCEAADPLVLTDDGVETPDWLIGRSGTVTVEKPNLTMEMQLGRPVRPIEPKLLAFPPTGETHRGYDLPEGYVRIEGRLYEVVDERDVDECPHCGSDKVTASAGASRCYGCERTFDGDGSGGDHSADDGGDHE